MAADVINDLWESDNPITRNKAKLDAIVKDLQYNDAYADIASDNSKKDLFVEYISSASSGFEKLNIASRKDIEYNFCLAEWCEYTRLAVITDMLFRLWLARTTYKVDDLHYLSMSFDICYQYIKWRRSSYGEYGQYTINLFNDYKEINEKYVEDKPYILTMKEFFTAFIAEKEMDKYIDDVKENDNKVVICGVEITKEKLRRAKIAAAMQLCIPEKYVEINLLEE